MADSRAKDLVKRTINSLASITGVRLWSDKDGEGDAKGVELSELMNSGAVAEGSTNDYQAVTPKGFAASVATEARKGIVEKATDAEIEAETAEKFMDAADQVTIRRHWGKAKDISNALGRPKFFFENGQGESEDVSRTHIIPVCFSTTRADSANTLYYPIPDEARPAGHVLAVVRVVGCFRNSLGFGSVDELLQVSTGTKEIRMPSTSNNFKWVFPTSESPPYISSSLSAYQQFTGHIYLIWKPV